MSIISFFKKKNNKRAKENTDKYIGLDCVDNKELTALLKEDLESLIKNPYMPSYWYVIDKMPDWVKERRESIIQVDKIRKEAEAVMNYIINMENDVIWKDLGKSTASKIHPLNGLAYCLHFLWLLHRNKEHFGAEKDFNRFLNNNVREYFYYIGKEFQKLYYI